MTTQLMPTVGNDLDPITRTWLRGLITTALERQLRPLCWHIEDSGNGAVATGYVTVSLLREASNIRETWARELGLTAAVDNHGRPTYTGSSGALTITLPTAIDPDEHCRVCNSPFDPRDTREDGLARYHGGEVCRSCAATRLAD